MDLASGMAGFRDLGTSERLAFPSSAASGSLLLLLSASAVEATVPHLY